MAAAVTATLAGASAFTLSSPAQAAAEQISNGSFDSEIAPWYAYGVVDGSTRLEDGQLCVDVPDGTVNPWDAAIVLDNVPAIEGEGYEFTFKARANKDVVPNVWFQHGSGGYEGVVGGNPTVTTEQQSFTFNGTAPLSFDNGQVVFQVGGKGELTFCIDDVSLLGGVEPPKYEPDTGPRVRVNQHGYLPEGPKGATLVTEATEALPFQVKDEKGKVVFSGETTPRGVDPTSGQNVHSLDFTALKRPGKGLTVTADGETSHPFDVEKHVYKALRNDAKTFFYTNRSGIEILDSLAPGYGRAAGHIGVAPNQGDTAVSCQDPVAFMDNWTCDDSFTLDVTGGWYDAGDHGKYVVNGGISVAQLMGEYERNQRAHGVDKPALNDKTLSIPEAGNKVPDILDEARWELDFLLKMQVPASDDPGLAPYEGMAFHKVHDKGWTGLPLAPAMDPQVRQLHRPSTAATLNLAAAAAQGARVFAKFDKAYSQKLLAAAEKAYAAALKTPDLYAPAADGNDGGGPYDDVDVSDEFYWAAAELYLTTGKKSYEDNVLSNKHHTGDVFTLTAFGWQQVAPLARLQLATVPSKLPGRAEVVKSVLDGADDLLAMQQEQAYEQLYAPAGAMFDWGSNSTILNNMVVLGTAFDLSGKAKYLEGVLRSADYLLGRNALNISYITGYGEVFSKNQHSRMYANQLEPSLPNPPVGTVSGGPNSSIQDPVAQAKLKGCLGQFCYIDDIGSWATNEITVNWNAPMSWVGSFLADAGHGPYPKK